MSGDEELVGLVFLITLVPLAAGVIIAGALFVLSVPIVLWRQTKRAKKMPARLWIPLFMASMVTIGASIAVALDAGLPRLETEWDFLWVLLGIGAWLVAGTALFYAFFVGLAVLIGLHRGVQRLSQLLLKR